MFENCQGINTMGLSASLDDYKKPILHKYENITNNLKKKHKKYKGFTQYAFVTLGTTLLFTTEKSTKLRQKRLDH